jgi:hypothetical protein
VRLTEQVAASKNRVLATDQFAWLGLSDILPPYEAAAFWVRVNWYDPWRVLEAGEETIAEAWRAVACEQPVDTSWIPALLRRAERVVTLYADPDRVPYALLQAHLQREQERIHRAQAQVRYLRLQVVRPIYHQLHPH